MYQQATNDFFLQEINNIDRILFLRSLNKVQFTQLIERWTVYIHHHTRSLGLLHEINPKKKEKGGRMEVLQSIRPVMSSDSRDKGD